MSEGRRLSITQVAERLGVSRDTVMRLVAAGEFEAANVGVGQVPRWTIAEADVSAFIARRSYTPKASA